MQKLNKLTILTITTLVFVFMLVACNRGISPLKPHITYQQACEIWDIQPDSIEPQIRYTEQTLKWAAKQNQEGEDWRLVYIHGFSLNQMDEKLKDKYWKAFSSKKAFKSLWWRNEKFAESTFFSDYCLINFKPKFFYQTWTEQKENIKKLENQSRTPITIFVESIFSIYMHSGERITYDDKSFLHWGKLIDSGGDRVYLGFFISTGLHIDRRSDDYRDSELGLSLLRNFDF